MPFIHVKSPAGRRPAAVAETLEGLCADVARETGVAVEHLTATWAELAPGHYAAGGTAAPDSDGRQPLLVDILLPDLHPPERVEAILGAVVASLGARAGVPAGAIFINARYARSGMVFDGGEIVRW